MKIAYIGIDLLFPVLDALIGEQCEVMKIFTCKTDNITEFNTEIIRTAQENNIPYTMERIRKSDLEELENNGCDLIVCAGYYYLVPISGKIPMVNFHPAPLPDYRGSWPMPVLLLRGEKQGAIAAHKMAEHFDTGDIVLQEYFSVEEDETLESYMVKACGKIPAMVNKLVNNLSELLRKAVRQDKGEYIEAPQKKDCTVNAKMTVFEADRILRAFYGYECYYDDGNKITEIIGGRAFKGKCSDGLRLTDGYIRKTDR